MILHRSTRLLLLLLAPLATACAMEDAVPPAVTASAQRSAQSNEPALPLSADASAEAKLTQNYANALVNQLNVEREQRRRELAEMKRRAQTERRIAELTRRKQQLERRQPPPATVAAKPAPAQTALAIAPAVALPAQLPAKAQVQVQMPQPPADMPEFESAASIPLPKPLRPVRSDGTRNQPEPVLFDPESRKGG